MRFQISALSCVRVHEPRSAAHELTTDNHTVAGIFLFDICGEPWAPSAVRALLKRTESSVSADKLQRQATGKWNTHRVSAGPKSEI